MTDIEGLVANLVKIAKGQDLEELEVTAEGVTCRIRTRPGIALNFEHAAVNGISTESAEAAEPDLFYSVE